MLHKRYKVVNNVQLAAKVNNNTPMLYKGRIYSLVWFNT